MISELLIFATGLGIGFALGLFTFGVARTIVTIEERFGREQS